MCKVDDQITLYALSLFFFAVFSTIPPALYAPNPHSPVFIKKKTHTPLIYLPTRHSLFGIIVSLFFLLPALWVFMLFPQPLQGKLISMRNYAYGDLEVATKGFAVERLIGKGSHGRVYVGALEGGKVVAVKKASEGLCLLQDDSRLGNEAEILSSLSTPRIVNLLGVSNDLDGHKVLVMEFMHNGSLEDCLHYTAYPPPWPRRSLMILQIAMAIQALHEASPPIIHRDVKSANILIDSKWNARLADFGLAVRARSSDELHVHNDGVVPAGTIGYLDPSYTSPTSLSPKNDIFSFGVLLLEIVSGRRAMDVGMEPPSITEWAVPLIDQDQMDEIYDSRVPIDKNTKRVAWSMLKMAKRCVATEEEQIRPTIREIVAELRTVLDESHRASLWNTVKKIGFRRHRNSPIVMCKIEKKSP